MEWRTVEEKMENFCEFCKLEFGNEKVFDLHTKSIFTGFQTFLPTALEHVSAPNIYCVGYDIDSLHVHVIQVYYVMMAIHTVEI